MIWVSLRMLIETPVASGPAEEALERLVIGYPTVGAKPPATEQQRERVDGVVREQT